jgi:hypothetical protein
MGTLELWVAALRVRQVACRPAGLPHYRRLSMYELIDFNGFLNVQVASFTGLVAIFRFLTATKAHRSEDWSVRRNGRPQAFDLRLCLTFLKPSGNLTCHQV